MDLHAELSGRIETALARMAPGEKVGWVLGPAVEPAGSGVRLLLFTPSPIVGQAINWHYASGNPFELFTDGALDLVLSTGLTAMRNFAAAQLAR